MSPLVRFAVALLAAAFFTSSLRADDPLAIPAADQPPVIDGKLDDPCWADGKPIAGFRKRGSDSPSVLTTELRLCHDAANLYVGILCPLAKDVEPRAQATVRDADIFGDDLVEFMLAPDSNRPMYVELAVNAAGGTFDALRFDGGRQYDRRWNGDWTAEVARGDGFYAVEIAIPYYTLPLPETGETPWRCNAVRQSIDPKELSAIAEGGEFHDVAKFIELAPPPVDLERFRFAIVPSDVLFDYRSDEVRGLLELEAVNLGEKPRQVTLSLELPGMEDQAAVSEPMTLESGQAATRTLEFDVEQLWKNRTDFYLLVGRPVLPRLVVRDAANKEIVGALQPDPPQYGWPLRVFVENPWQPETTAEKSATINMAVATLLPDELRQKASIQVTVVSRETGEGVAAPLITGPERMMPVAVDAGKLPWGAFDVHVTLNDAEGRVIATTSQPGLVLAPAPYQIEVLNNLVSELANTARRGNAGEASLPFLNPRDGWCFFQVTGDGVVRLDDAAAPLVAGAAGGEPAEAMRRLPAGKHVLAIEGQPQSVIVRAIPEIVYNVYPATTQIAPFGTQTWDLLQQEMLPQCNVVQGYRLPEEGIRAWRDEGKKWLLSTGVPGLDAQPVSVNDVLAYWQKCPAYASELADGMLADEFLPRIPDWQYLRYSQAVARLAEDPQFRGKSLVPLATGLYQTPGGALFTETLYRCGWPMALATYIPEAGDEAENQRQIEAALAGQAMRYEELLPGSFRRAVVTLMYSSLPYCMANVQPAANFKVHLDMQLHTLATHPALFAPYGVQPFRSNYVDPDMLRTMGRLLRHYAIEGSRERLLDDPYLLPHLENPDFASGSDGWKLEPAAPDAIRVETVAGYGALQGRYPWSLRLGDQFLVMRRSEQGPNVVRQEIRQLEPGRRYSLRVISASFDDLAGGVSEKRPPAVRIAVEGATAIEGPTYRFEHPFRSAVAAAGFSRDKPFWMTFHWQVFQAKQASAELQIIDWPSPEEPGKAGVQTAVGFVELQPYDGP